MILSDLKKHINGAFLIAGVGNELKEFDRIGVEIARKGLEIYPETFIDCGVAPENYLDKIVQKKIRTLILVDAVRYEEGDKAKIFLPEQLSVQGISTHSCSLRLMADYLRNYGIKTVVVAIRPDGDIEETKQKVLSRLLQLVEDR